MRTRAHLNDQIKQKIKKEYEEELKKKEYDQLMDKHLKHLNELEAEKQRLLKERALKTKELRDKQQRESYVTKRIDVQDGSVGHWVVSIIHSISWIFRRCCLPHSKSISGRRKEPSRQQ